MQHIGLPYLKTLVTENRFQPRGATLEHASTSTCIMIDFVPNAEYTDIKHIHIGLVVIQKGFRPCEQKISCPSWMSSMGTFRQSVRKSCLCLAHTASSQQALVGGWQCLLIPLIAWFTPQSLLMALPQWQETIITWGTHHALCTRQCICHCTLQYANMLPDDQMEYTGSRLLIPLGVQYSRMAFPN